MVKPIIQLVVAGAQAVSKAFMKAVRQEISASQAAAARAGGGKTGERHVAASQKLGLSLQEAKQILNVEQLNKEDIQNRYEILFKMNEKSAGGSFYLQSKMKCVSPMLNGSLALPRLITPTSCRLYSTFQPTYDSIFSDQNKAQCIKTLQSMPSLRKSPEKPSKLSSILVPLCTAEGKPCLLYTLRNRNLRSYAGQVCFPGGVIEDNDDGPVGTALRETFEEIGLRKESISIWGSGASIPTRFGDSSVTIVLGYVGDVNENSFHINPDEVAEVFAVPLHVLCDPKNYGNTTFRSSHFKRGYSIPVFVGTEPRIWGLTGIVTHIVLKALLPGLYRHDLKQLKFLKR